jgi:hypothetical protein
VPAYHIQYVYVIIRNVDKISSTRWRSYFFFLQGGKSENSEPIYFYNAEKRKKNESGCGSYFVIVPKLTFAVLPVMRSLFIFLFIALIFCPRAGAQNGYYLEEPKVFSGGLVAGGNFTQVDGDTFYGYDKVGLNAGGVVYVRFSGNVGASMEIDYTQKGSRAEVISSSVALGTYVQKYFMNLNYVEVPITVHGKTYVKSHLLYIEAGLSYAYLIKSSEWVQADPPVIVDPVLNRFNTTDFDYIVGMNLNLYKNLYLNGRYQYSILSIRPTDRVPIGYSYGNKGQFNNMFNLRLMYLF